MDGPGDPGRDVAQGRAPGLTAPARVAIVSNGNYFAALGLAALLESTAYDFLVFVTTATRHPDRSFWPQTSALVRRWGLRYAAYKVGVLALPAVAQLTRRRPYSLFALARQSGVQVRRCHDLNVGEDFAALQGFAPDLLISFSCPYRLQPQVLSMPRIGALNVHASLLPADAGVGTYVHVLAEGRTTTGVSLHVMTHRFDAGAVLAQRQIAIAPGCSVFELFARLCREAGVLLPATVDEAVARGRLMGTPQDLSRRTYHAEPRAADIRRLRRRGHHLFRESDLHRLWSDAGSVTW